MASIVTATFCLIPSQNGDRARLLVNLDGIDTIMILDDQASFSRETNWWQGEITSPINLPDWLDFSLFYDREAEAIKFFMDFLPRQFGRQFIFRLVPMTDLWTGNNPPDVVHYLTTRSPLDSVIEAVLSNSVSNP